MQVHEAKLDTSKAEGIATNSTAFLEEKEGEGKPSGVVKQDGKEVAVKKMKKAIPAEMIQFKVKADNINGTGDLEVMVEC